MISPSMSSTRSSGSIIPTSAVTTIVLGDDVFDRERFANLGAGFGRRVDEHLVEHGPPRPVRERGVGGARRRLRL